jgi:hypothetical protein
MYRGFPIGTLLFWKRKGEAGRVQLGLIDLEVPEQADALWIVDGQQRVTSLVGSLAPPRPVPECDLHFDLTWDDAEPHEASRTPFAFADPRKPFGPTCLPLRVVIDSEQLDAWLDEEGAVAEHKRRARRLNKIVREYKVPAYVVETDDTETLGLIFDRVIATGNADMHHKNWSLLYPDGVKAVLAPAYDLVATVVYPGVSDELGLKFGKVRRWEEVRQSTFQLLASEAGANPTETVELAEATLDAIVRARPEAEAQAQPPKEAWERIDAHWKRVPFLAKRVA